MTAEEYSPRPTLPSATALPQPPPPLLLPPPLLSPPSHHWRQPHGRVETAGLKGNMFGQATRTGNFASSPPASREETAGRKWALAVPSREEDAPIVVRETQQLVKSIERSRRGKMNEMYAALQSMVPNLFHKAAKARILDETINYIEELEGSIRVLEAAKKAQKRARMAGTSSSVDVTISGKMAFFGVRSPWRPGLAVRVLQVFDKHQAEVLSAAVSHEGEPSRGRRGSQGMAISVTAMADEAAVEGVEEELMAMLSNQATTA